MLQEDDVRSKEGEWRSESGELEKRGQFEEIRTIGVGKSKGVVSRGMGRGGRNRGLRVQAVATKGGDCRRRLREKALTPSCVCGFVLLYRRNKRVGPNLSP